MRRTTKSAKSASKSVNKSANYMQTMTTSLWRRLQEGGFILLGALALFLWVSLVTYNEADPGWSRTATHTLVSNAGGKTGAWFSDLFLFLFGYMAYMFPFMIAFGGFQLYQNRFQIGIFNRLLWILRLVGFVLAVVSGCGLASLHFGAYETSNAFNCGGIVGQVVIEQLLQAFAFLGSTLMLMSVFLAGITLSTGLSWFGVMDYIGLRLLNGLKSLRFDLPFLFGKIVHGVKLLSVNQKKSIPQPSLLPLLTAKSMLKNNASTALSEKRGKPKTFSEQARGHFDADETFMSHETLMENETLEDENSHALVPLGDRLGIHPYFSAIEKSKKRRAQNESEDAQFTLQTDSLQEDAHSNASQRTRHNTKQNAGSQKAITHRDALEKERDSLDTESAKEFGKIKEISKAKSDNPRTFKKGAATLPSVTLLEAVKSGAHARTFSSSKLEALSREVEARLLEFGVHVNVVAVLPGPVITRFELELAAGLKASKITGLAKDLARSLLVTRVRVVEVIPGKSVVGLEIPNEHREIVRFREILESPLYQESTSPLSLALGKDIAGEPMVVNLAKMPHLLVAGTTGSGKSVGVNAMLLSLLYKATPDEVRLILIDPKMLELSIYDGIPHLLTPVVTDMKDAANALRWCVAEMERRYQLMAAVGVRNLMGYNGKIEEAEAHNKPIPHPLWKPEMGGERPFLSRLPYIVVIIDEFADMMMVVGKKVEELIARIAQKARAAGIHMILATQRPSVDVITGLIKANVPTRIAFQVSSRIDSRTILDQQGAEQLLGHGDMLFLAPGTGIPIRIHGAFVSDEEVHAVVKALKQLGEPDYAEDILGSSGFGASLGSGFGGGAFDGEEDGEQDELYDQAVQIVIESRKASISHLQRRLKVGYNRAARLIETMEAAGVVSSMQSNGGREVLSGEMMD